MSYLSSHGNEQKSAIAAKLAVVSVVAMTLRNELNCYTHVAEMTK